jgi:hypothetical protein
LTAEATIVRLMELGPIYRRQRGGAGT